MVDDRRWSIQEGGVYARLLARAFLPLAAIATAILFVAARDRAAEGKPIPTTRWALVTIGALPSLFAALGASGIASSAKLFAQPFNEDPQVDAKPHAPT